MFGSFFGGAAPASKVVEINGDGELRAFLAKHPAAVVDFKAAWCGPCKMCAPVFASLSLKYENVGFASVDVDANPSIAASAGVSAMPTFVVYRSGAPFKTVVGADMKAVAAAIDEVAASAPAPAFSGAGRTLAGGAAAAAAPAAAPSGSGGPATVDAADLDPTADVVKVTVRTLGGGRLTARLNGRHTVADLAALVAKATGTAGAVLAAGFPPAPLEPGTSLAVAGVADSVVTQRAA